MSLKKAFNIILSICLFVASIMALWWFLPARTPEIKTSNKQAVSEIDYIEIGGINQCVLIRSENRTNPILLFLHGGPGMPMMYLAHEFQHPLEKNFTVVQWDRRGAGKTFARNKPSKESMNVRQLLDDAYTLIDTLRNRYHQDKIILAGHSFGTYLGSIMVNERPELFSAYISIGQVVDSDKARPLKEQFIRKKAAENGRDDIISALDDSSNLNLENWLFEFGGELKNSTSFIPLVWSGLQAPEYTLPEVLKVAEGSSFSSNNMNYNVLDRSIYYEIRKYQIPVYFFVGTSDYTTPHELVEEYASLISAPKKKMIYFRHSAHFPFYEEPGKFSQEITKILANPNHQDQY
jgi:pimeloyl-ACP methyl ester carboxylesterase